MRLIDTEALGVGRCSKDILPAAYCAGWNGLLNIINDAPTIDAVLWLGAGSAYTTKSAMNGKLASGCYAKSIITHT